MADPVKTSWTNADLIRPAQEDTIYGPWTTVPGSNPSRPRTALDDLIESGVSVDELLRHADEVLRRSRPLQAQLNDVGRRQFEPQAAAAQARAASPVRQFVRGVRESPVSQGAMLAGSIIPSPAAPAFSGALALDALLGAAEDPNLMSVANAGLMLTPGYRLGREFVTGRKAAQEAKTVAEGLYRQTGMSRGREVPYRMSGQVSSSARPSMAALTKDVPVTRVPMGAMGDEYADIRNTGGPFTAERKGARFEDWPPELWDYVLSGFGK